MQNAAVLLQTAEAFETLGLPRNASPRDVKAAFRRLALLHHPDKAAANNINSQTPDDTATEFAKVHRAFKLALDAAEREEQSREQEGGAGAKRDEIVVSMLLASLRALFTLFVISMSAAVEPSLAQTIELNIRVSMEDVYMARVKKIVLNVTRVSTAFSSSQEKTTLFVPLLHFFNRNCRTFTFAQQGDDTIDVLTGRVVRGDVTVTVSLISEEKVRAHGYDLCFHTTLTPQELYYGGPRARVPHYRGRDIDLQGDEVQRLQHLERPGNTERVFVARGLGLPTTSASHPLGHLKEEEGGGGGRGDVYVFATLQMPPLTDAHLSQDAVKDAFATAFGGSG